MRMPYQDIKLVVTDENGVTWALPKPEKSVS